MAEWTLEYDGTEKSFAQWGLCQPVLRFVSFDISTCTFDHVGAAFDGAPLFPFESTIIVRCGGVVVFRGEITETPRGVRGAEEHVGYVASDLFYALSITPYQQAWTGAGTQGRVVLFADEDGSTSSAGAMFAQIIDYAQSECGLPVAFGSATGITVQPVSYDAREVVILEALRLVRAWCPDVATRVDYTADPPAVHFVKRSNAAVHSLPVEAAANALDIRPLYASQVGSVVIRYVTRNTVDGEVVPSITTDAYPEGSTGKERRAVVLSVDLAGAARQSQYLQTVNIEPDANWWWKRHAGWLHDVTDLVIEEGAIKVPAADGSAVDGPNTYGWVREIVAGAVPGWIPEDDHVSGTVRVTATASYTKDGVAQTGKKLMANVQATSLGGGTYWHEDRSAVESVPLGLAEAYYGSTNPLQWAGQYVIDEDEVTLTLPRPASVLNLTGGAAAARGWTTMKAQVQDVTVDVQQGRTSITFGAPEHLGLQDLIGQMRSRSGLSESQTRLERAGQAGAGGAIGPQRMAGAALVPEPDTTEMMPLTVYRLADGTLSVTPGQVAGMPIRSGAIDGPLITSTDPPTWDISTTGVLYLGVKVDLTFSHDMLISWSNVRPFVASAVSTPAEDWTAGEYVRVLATVVDGVLTANYSPRHNLELDVRDVGEADSRAAPLFINA